MKSRPRVLVELYGWTLGQWAEAVVYYRLFHPDPPADITGAVDVWQCWTYRRSDFPTGTPIISSALAIDLAWASRMFAAVLQLI